MSFTNTALSMAGVPMPINTAVRVMAPRIFSVPRQTLGRERTAIYQLIMPTKVSMSKVAKRSDDQ